MQESQASRKIHILREDVSRRIAAGEVIDRPLAIVRELIDNALDAEARFVDVYLEEGGLGLVRVVDDGQGIAREDLELCTERHATSKIESDEDLLRIRTLGFRGEALASIAACARLRIVSAASAAGAAHRLVVEGGRRIALEPCQGARGTSVDAADLFFNLPARKRFLKSPAAEAQLCRQVFLEKALAYPGVAFRLFSDGALRHFLPVRELKERVSAAYALDPAHLYVGRGEAPGAAVQVVAARPELARRDRRLLQIFVNRRRIHEFALVQAVEYAFGEHVPGGSFPAAFVFLEVEPALVDFNVHPAKREARFRTLPELRQAVIGTIRRVLEPFNLQAAVPRPHEPDLTHAETAGELELPLDRRAAPPDAAGVAAETGRWPAAEQWRKGAAALTPQPAEGAPGEPRYCGQAFGLFLVVERGEDLFLVDQHAAHERLLFDELKGREYGSQELLLPLRLEQGAGLEAGLVRFADSLRRLGIRVQRGEDGGWEVTALPEELLCIEEELAAALAGEAASPQELEDRLLSLAACRTAVKEGEELDPLTARELARRALALENARCPHGRPLWMRIRKAELLRAVGRV
jgi:DNA mismatch repair protein MutL